MANSLRAVQSRINSTKSTAQITKAMYMVSQSKVKRAEKTFKSYQDFMARISSMVSDIVDKASEEYPHKLLLPREVKKTAYIIISSDNGLAGGYNATVFKALDERIASEHKSSDEFVTGAIGKKGYAHIVRKGYPTLNDALNVWTNVASALKI